MPWGLTHSRTRIQPTRIHVRREDTNCRPTKRYANTGILGLFDSAIGHNGRSHFFDIDSDGSSDDIGGFVSDVTTVAQLRGERATDYADIETLICRLPLDHWTFAAYDAAGPSPMALLMQAFIIENINGWDETALHDYLRANPSLRRGLGFETLPHQSTFWRAWNHRFSAELCETVQECADRIITAARTCGASLRNRIETDEADKTKANDCQQHQLVSKMTDEVWQQAKPFVCDVFAFN